MTRLYFRYLQNTDFSVLIVSDPQRYVLTAVAERVFSYVKCRETATDYLSREKVRAQVLVHIRANGFFYLPDILAFFLRRLLGWRFADNNELNVRAFKFDQHGAQNVPLDAVLFLVYPEF